MNEDNIVLGDRGNLFIECKFTVEGDEMMGGDWEKNIGIVGVVMVGCLIALWRNE